uniref:Putative RNA-directed DNA polymerase n=1 Tax=Sipha flava TaxID=143950 RepID=A0A2S2Q5A3_9HEMI
MHLNLISTWCTKWRIKLNHTKLLHTTFTLKHGLCPPVSLDNIPIPASDTVKYLSLIMDKRLTLNPYIKSKRLILNSRSRMLKTMLSKNKCTNIKNKLLIYKTILKPIWTYSL